MKYKNLNIIIVFIFIFLLNFSLYAQQSNYSPDNYAQIKFGYLIDGISNSNYKGFNAVNLGWSRHENKRIQNFEIELIRYKSQLELYTRERKSIEAIYSYSIILSKNKNGFYVGPVASIIATEIEIEPLTSSSFPIATSCFCSGLGLNSGFNWRLNDKLILGLSSRLTVFEFGLIGQHIENPVLPEELRTMSALHFDIIRKQYQLMLDIKFRI